MFIPDGLLPKPEILLTYIVSIVLSITNILDQSGKLVAILSTIVISYFLIRMYISQRKLNEMELKIKQAKLKALEAGESELE